MAINAQTKKSDWLSDVIRDVLAVANAIRVMRETTADYSGNAFDGGDLANRPEYQITDQDLIDLGFPHLNAAKLNAFIGGANALTSTYDANRGIIEAARY